MLDTSLQNLLKLQFFECGSLGAQLAHDNIPTYDHHQTSGGMGKTHHHNMQG